MKKKSNTKQMGLMAFLLWLCFAFGTSIALAKFEKEDRETEEIIEPEPLPQSEKAKDAVPKVEEQAQIDQVQSEIQQIIKMNESLKGQYRAQAVQIQRIQEQARIHQKILKDLEALNKRKLVAAPPADANALIRQEKIRLIRQETERNRKMMENINQINEVQKVNKLNKSNG